MEMKQLLSKEKQVYRVGNTIHRPAQPWSPSIHAFLIHLEKKGLPVPHPYGIDGAEEIIEYVEGEQVHPHKWTDEALFQIGELAAQLHAAAADFPIASSVQWNPWYLREIGNEKRICCHGDFAPWNIITENGFPKVIIDWEMAGPLDPMVELARICWLFPQLVDDDLQALYDLPSPEKRAEQVRIICDGYGLDADRRHTLVQQIIESIICETAHEAIDPSLTFESTGQLWGFAWRTRSLYWIWRNRSILEKALV